MSHLIVALPGIGNLVTAAADRPEPRPGLRRASVVSHPSGMTPGFKEWTLICEALGRGEQSIILRKGGIAEGRAGFRFQHEEFLLFPTLFHEQAAKLKVPADTPLPGPRTDGQLEVRLQCRVEWTKDLTDWPTVQRLAPVHLWQEFEIEKRFRQEEKPGVSLAFVRVSRLSEPIVFPDSPRYGGCRSWIQLPDVPPNIAVAPVLASSEHEAVGKRIKHILGKSES